MELSFCIPTFNRINTLRLTIDSVLKIENIEYEICISDNNSNDGTKEYLQALSNKNIKIHCQNFNVGIDNNMVKVMKMGVGRFIFLLGDDDYINSKYLDNINLILQQEPSLVVFTKTNKEKVFINDLEMAYKAIWDKMSFGYILFKRELISFPLNRKFIGTYHAYSGWVLTGIQKINKIKDVKIIISPIEIIKTNYVEKSWSSKSFEINFVSIPMFLRLIEFDTNNEVYKKYVNNSTKARNLLRNKAIRNMIYDKKLLKKLKENYSWISILKMRVFLSFPIHNLYNYFKNQ